MGKYNQADLTKILAGVGELVTRQKCECQKCECQKCEFSHFCHCHKCEYLHFWHCHKCEYSHFCQFFNVTNANF